ncbi:peroxiredoxin [Planobispora rosea]|uniref:Peroxiredoxin n=1 Tax=Planobispora rosea TaxID=35762 RepID=A0A8J3RWN4_PLARO|nr:OsmC family protein [Planobispora rosea]GGS69699.1 peroxiredoxin [Planobispora rosea]GIH83167.1 peroxiredoxin [Planobispora rosea]
MTREHRYRLTVSWTGNRGEGTAGYRAYGRDHEVSAPGKEPLAGSSDPAFRGDPARWNPEELLVASLSQCHMLWYLHLCASNGVVVTGYTDEPEGVMVEDADGAGNFREVVLRPAVTVASPEMEDTARQLHHEIHKYCFIARSVNFPVVPEPTIRSGTPAHDGTSDR